MGKKYVNACQLQLGFGFDMINFVLQSYYDDNCFLQLSALRFFWTPANLLAKGVAV